MAFNFSAVETKFKSILSLVEDDLKQIKTGRAKPSMVEDIQAEAYGSYMPIKELASISAPDVTMIVIQPWDQSVVSGIEKALQKSGHNPSVDGNQIRVLIPALTGEKRAEMIKQVAVHIESGKQMLRNERNDAKRDVEDQKGKPGISEDDIKADLESLDKLTHNYNDKLDQIGTDKKKELETI